MRHINNKTKSRIIDEMNNIINHYVDNELLFAGGCCYAAYVLAKYLTKLGIDYNTVLFQCADIIKIKNFVKAVNGYGVSHVAIEVKVDGKKMMIGKTDGIYQYFQCTQEEFSIRHYKKISPDDILDGYKNNSWNWMWNTDKNPQLDRDIENVYSKYCEGTV